MSQPTTGPRLTRRGLLVSASTAAAVAAAPRIGSAQDATPATPATTPVTDNGFVRSGVEGVPDVCLQLPVPAPSTAGPPGSGGTVRAFTIAYGTPPPARDQNTYWQELERRLGVTWECDMTPQASYGEKSAAYFAGGDLPDLFYLNPGQGATQQYQAMTQGAFLDLEPYVTGDALQQYPNLARFPRYAWDNCRFQGTLFGVPKPTGMAGDLPFIRTDWAATLGVTDAHPTATLIDLLTRMATGDPDGSGSRDTWGLGRFSSGWNAWDTLLLTYAHRVPQGWRLNPDGTLMNAIETDEYRQSIDAQRQLYAAGAYHPDAASLTYADARELFVSGRIGAHTEGFGSFYGANGIPGDMTLVNPAAAIGYLIPNNPDGGPGVTHSNPGYFGFVGIPARITDEARIAELLRILDYLAAPFGSEERVFLDNGIEGTHYNRDAAGNPITTEQGTLDRSDLTYIMGGPSVTYYPEDPELGLAVMQGNKDALAVGIPNPTLGLYSPANVEQGPALEQFGTDRITAIVTGREDFSALDGAIAEWKSRGGDQIRQEFLEAIAQRG